MTRKAHARMKPLNNVASVCPQQQRHVNLLRQSAVKVYLFELKVTACTKQSKAKSYSCFQISADLYIPRSVKRSCQRITNFHGFNGRSARERTSKSKDFSFSVYLMPFICGACMIIDPNPKGAQIGLHHFPLGSARWLRFRRHRH